MKNRFQKLVIPFFILFIGITLYYSDVFSYFISGDDIWQYLEAPKDWKMVWHLFTFIQQYRPLPHIFFDLYHVVPFSIPLFHFISILFVSFISFLFYFFLSRYLKVKMVISLGIALIWSLSHIIFYHIYALAGTADLVFMFFFWFSILFFLKYSRKHNNYSLLISWVSFIMAIFSKEIFISIPLLVSLFTLLPLEKKSTKRNVRILVLYWIPTLLFYVIKIFLYKSNGSAYTYSFTMSMGLSNIKHFILWFLNYRHGWQMGMPLPVSRQYYSAIAIDAIFMMYFIIRAFRSRTIVIVFIFWILAALLPFFFLDRVLVYYLNVSLFGLLALVAYGLQDFYKKHRYISIIGIVTLLLLNLFISTTIKKQWKVYSFVAVANETSVNFYRKIVGPYKWSREKNILCLKNLNGDAMWAVAEGRELYMFTQQTPKILLTKEQYPPQCFAKRSVRFKNEGRSFNQE